MEYCNGTVNESAGAKQALAFGLLKETNKDIRSV
jgi:hypothetical protein